MVPTQKAEWSKGLSLEDPSKEQCTSGNTEEFLMSIQIATRFFIKECKIFKY